MKIDFSKYALMLENNAFVVPANPIAQEITEAETLSVEDTDSVEVKAVKKIINNPKSNKATYDEIIKAVEALTKNADEKVTSAPIKFKVGDTELQVTANRKKDAKGKFAIWFEAAKADQTVDVSKIDFDYLAAKVNKAIDNLGTDEDALAQIGSAMRLYAMRNTGGNIKPILDKLREKYKTVYEESFDEALDGDMDGFDLTYMQYLYGIKGLSFDGAKPSIVASIKGVGSIELTEESVFEFTTKLKNKADENMDALGTQMQIAAMILGLNEKSAKLVKANWEKNYSEDNFIEFIIEEEFVDGVQAVLKAYWSAISGEGDAGIINGYLAKMSKTAKTTE